MYMQLAHLAMCARMARQEGQASYGLSDQQLHKLGCWLSSQSVSSQIHESVRNNCSTIMLRGVPDGYTRETRSCVHEEHIDHLIASGCTVLGIQIDDGHTEIEVITSASSVKANVLLLAYRVVNGTFCHIVHTTPSNPTNGNVIYGGGYMRDLFLKSSDTSAKNS